MDDCSDRPATFQSCMSLNQRENQKNLAGRAPTSAAASLPHTAHLLIIAPTSSSIQRTPTTFIHLSTLTTFKVCTPSSMAMSCGKRIPHPYILSTYPTCTREIRPYPWKATDGDVRVLSGDVRATRRGCERMKSTMSVARRHPKRMKITDERRLLPGPLDDRGWWWRRRTEKRGSVLVVEHLRHSHESQAFSSLRLKPLL